MQLKRIETPGLSHYAWLLADGGEAALIDPSRDIAPYLEAARMVDARIRYVVETHRQEDFVMGAAHLARTTGASVVNGRHELFGHGDIRLADGETLTVGSLTLRALETPGHTPESMSWAVFTDADATEAWCVFTGDALFFGTTGRTDLPDADRSVENAGLLWDSVHDKLAGLGDTTLICPAHGPGSVCGGGMNDRPWSTLGEEKRYNEVFTLEREQFARKKGGERLPRPPYFRRMEKINLEGGRAPTLERGSVPLLDAEDFAASREGARVFDLREPEAFAGGHIEGSYGIWLGGLPVFGGWFGNDETPLLLVGDDSAAVDTATGYLSRIGVDHVSGALASGFGSWRKSGLPIGRAATITPRELHAAENTLQVLDVREIDEFDSGHIPQARWMYVGYLEDRLGELDLHRDAPVVVTCGVGHRAGIALSILLREGFTDVRNLLGGMSAWTGLDYPTEESGDTENDRGGS